MYMKGSAHTSRHDAYTGSCFLIVSMEDLEEGSASLRELMAITENVVYTRKGQTLPECVCFVDALPSRSRERPRGSAKYVAWPGLGGVLLSTSSCCSGGAQP